jgi:hypothetical protein
MSPRRLTVLTVVCLAALTVGATVSHAGQHALGRYSGTIALPPSKISFELVPGHVKRITTDHMPIPCKNGQFGGTYANGTGGAVLRHRKFKSDARAGAQEHTIEGTVSGRHASGRIRLTALVNSTTGATDPHGTVLCNTGWLRWTAASHDRSAATRSRGSFKGRVVSFAHIGFTASAGTIDGVVMPPIPLPCSDGPFASNSLNGWTALPVRGERFTAVDGPGPFQGTGISGALNGKRASGTLRILVRRGPTGALDPSGSVTCDSGQLSWSATAG